MEGHSLERDGSNVILTRYKIIRTLGNGASGKVKSAIHLLTGLKVAIKILSRRKMKKLDMEEKVAREIKILGLFMHPHVIRLYEVIETNTHVYLVMELVDKGELFDYIVLKGRVPENEARQFFQQLISGVEYCHKNQVAHRDLKPENLLLGPNGIKIIDFGLSNVIRDGHFLKTSCGSPNYAAPEVISGKLYVGYEIDVWSCGVILYALLCGTLPFDDPNIANLYKKIKNGSYKFPSYLSPGARDLIQKILIVDPTERLTIPAIKQHPWFQFQAPQYLALIPSDTVHLVRKTDERIIQEVVNLGFERNHLVESLLNRRQNEATISYYLLLDSRLHASNNYHGFFECQEMECEFPHTRPLLGAIDDQGTSKGSNFPNENKWTLGLQSTAHPHDIMIEVVRALSELRVSWKENGIYNIKCLWQPDLPGSSEYRTTNPLHIDPKFNNNFISESENVPNNQFSHIRFEIQIYRTMDDKHLLDVQRTEGPHMLFFTLCTSLLHQLRVQ